MDVSGGTTGLTTSGGPITSSGTITLGGTLATTNGGTGTSTSFTTGSVVFAGASGVYSQNNAQLFWDNTNSRLGIGTSAPARALDVFGSLANTARFTSSATSTSVGLDNTNVSGWGSNIGFFTGGVNSGYFGTIGSLLGNTTQDLAAYANTGNGFRVYTNGNNLRASIDSSGNFTLNTGTFTYSAGTANGVAYLNGSKVLTTGSALTFDGTNLGVGLASPGCKVDILAASNASLAATLRVYSNNLAVNTAISYDGIQGSGDFYLGSTSNSPVIFKQNNAEQMRLTSTGLGIGTSSPATKLAASIASATAYSSSSTGNVLTLTNTTANGYAGIAFNTEPSSGNAGIAAINSFAPASGDSVLAFSTRSSAALAERARITSGGDLLVGTTSTASSSGTGFKVLANLGVTGHFDPTVVTPSNNTSQSCWDIYSTATSGYRFYVTTSGVVNAITTTISAISDQRLKENIQDLDVGLDAIMSLKPRKFDWKAGKGKDIKGDRGFIAQEFEQVFPDLIDEWRDPAPEGEEPYKSVRQDLIPVLVKAIQELKAELDTAKAELATLKGN